MLNEPFLIALYAMGGVANGYVFKRDERARVYDGSDERSVQKR